MFKKMEECKLFAMQANFPESTQSMISTAKYNIQQTRAFKDELKEWNCNNPNLASFDWIKFEDFWCKKYTEYKCDRQSLASMGCYHSAFNAEEKDDNVNTVMKFMANMAAANTANDARIESLETKIDNLAAALMAASI